MSRTTANILLLLAGAVWGMGFVAQSTAMESIGPIFFVGLRFVVATLVTIPFAVREAKSAETTLTRSHILGFIWTGSCLCGGMIFQQIGLLTTTVTNSGFLTGLYVIFVPFLVVIFLRRWPHPIIWPCAVLAFAGIWLLSGGSLSALVVGDILTIISAVFWASQVVLIGVFTARTSRPLTLSAVQFGVCAVLGLVIGAAVEPVSWSAIVNALPEILYTGVFAGGLAFSLQAIGQRYTTPAQAAVFLSSESLFAAFFGALFLGELISAIGYIGCLMIFIAILAVEVIPARRSALQQSTKSSP